MLRQQITLIFGTQGALADFGKEQATWFPNLPFKSRNDPRYLIPSTSGSRRTAGMVQKKMNACKAARQHNPGKNEFESVYAKADDKRRHRVKAASRYGRLGIADHVALRKVHSRVAQRLQNRRIGDMLGNGLYPHDMTDMVY
jgi:hypothetical protein